MNAPPRSKGLLMSSRWIFPAGAILWMLMTSQPSNSQEQQRQLSDASLAPASRKFAALSDQFMKDSLALSPSAASAAGYHTHLDTKTNQTIDLDAQLDDMSLDAIQSQRAFYATWRERFHTETPVASLNPEDAADWQLIDDQ